VEATNKIKYQPNIRWLQIP